MPAIDEINLQAAVNSTTDAEWIRGFIKAELWDWFEAHKDDKVKTVNFWIIHRTIYVRDLQAVFELILGPRP